MATLFVVDVAEFRPLVEAAIRLGGFDVAGPIAGYHRITTNGPLRINRSDTGLPEALWFGAFTGGFVGKEMRIDSEHFWIE